MIAHLLRRMAWGALVVWVVASLVFAAYFAAPGEVARLIAGRQASEDTVAAVRTRLGLDQPLPVQYVRFLGRLLHGDLGESFLTQERVIDVVARGLPVTASVAIGGAALWLLMGVGAGVLAAVRPRGLLDRSVTALAMFFYAVPTFLLGQLLLYLLFFQLYGLGIEWFPPGSYVAFGDDPVQWARFLMLPWLSLALTYAAAYARLTRSALLDSLGADYIRTARAKGLTERRVVLVHALRNALSPTVTQFGIDLGALFGGAVVTEVVFGLPGIGREIVQAVASQDLPVIIGIAIASTVAVVVVNLLTDVVQLLLDPRVRLR